MNSYLILKMPTHQAMRKWLRQQLLDADEESRTWRLRAIQVCDKMPVFFECCWILYFLDFFFSINPVIDERYNICDG